MSKPTTRPKNTIITPKQKLFMEYYLNPNSQHFGNAYKSALACGYSDEYAQNITSLKPQWLSDYIGKTHLEFEHIAQSVQELASFNRTIDSKSPDDTRLKALELLSKLQGHLIERKQVAQVIKVELGKVNKDIN